MKTISINVSEFYLRELDKLVLENKYPNRSEAIRTGIRDLVKRENGGSA